MKVLISHPFSGALYAFFTEHLAEYRTRPPGPREPHPYYRTLFGDRFPEYQEVALTLALLFDEIVIVPADSHLPPDDTTRIWGCTASGTSRFCRRSGTQFNLTSKMKRSAVFFDACRRYRNGKSSLTLATNSSWPNYIPARSCARAEGGG